MLGHLSDIDGTPDLGKDAVRSAVVAPLSIEERQADFIQSIKDCRYLVTTKSRRNDKTRVENKLDRIATQCQKAFRKNDIEAMEKLKQELHGLFEAKKGEASYVKECRGKIRDAITYLEAEIPTQHYQKSVMHVLEDNLDEAPIVIYPPGTAPTSCGETHVAPLEDVSGPTLVAEDPTEKKTPPKISRAVPSPRALKKASGKIDLILSGNLSITYLMHALRVASLWETHKALALEMLLPYHGSQVDAVQKCFSKFLIEVGKDGTLNDGMKESLRSEFLGNSGPIDDEIKEALRSEFAWTWKCIQGADSAARTLTKDLHAALGIDAKEHDISLEVFVDVLEKMQDLHATQLTPQERASVFKDLLEELWMMNLKKAPEPKSVRDYFHGHVKNVMKAPKAIRDAVLGLSLRTGIAVSAAMMPNLLDADSLPSHGHSPIHVEAAPDPDVKPVDEPVKSVWEGVQKKVGGAAEASIAVGELLRKNMDADKVLAGKMDDTEFFDRFKKELSKDGLGYTHTFNDLAPEAKTLNEMLAVPVIHKSPRLKEDLKNQAAALLLSPEEIAQILE